MDRRDEASPDYYQRLGVEPTASAEEIREAYRKKARHTHPDRNPEDPRAAENFRRVKEAYRVLRDPERRAQYDASPGPSESPEVVRLSQQVAMGCTGYLWRVFAGIVAVGLFFLLELFDVWSAQGVWVIGLAVGGASFVAGLIAAVAARYFPDQAGDVTIRLSSERLKMWADGHLALDLSWSRAQAVRLREGGGLLELEVDPESAPRVHPVPPVLIHVDRDRDPGLLRFDLSATDVRGAVLRSFLETEDPIPFANANVEEQTRHNGSNVTGNGS